MRQFIAPGILMVNGKPSPCECRGDTVCAYCVQANLLLWEREQEPKMNEKEAIKKIQEHGIRRFSRESGVPLRTINNWNKRGFIPQSKLEKIELFFRE